MNLLTQLWNKMFPSKRKDAVEQYLEHRAKFIKEYKEPAFLNDGVFNRKEFEIQTNPIYNTPFTAIHNNMITKSERDIRIVTFTDWLLFNYSTSKTEGGTYMWLKNEQQLDSSYVDMPVMGFSDEIYAYFQKRYNLD